MISSKKILPSIAQYAFLIMVFVLFAGKIFACALCGFAGIDRYLPPVFYWCILAVLWSLSIVIVGMVFKANEPENISGKQKLLLITGCIIGGLYIIGPLAIVPLVFFPSLSLYRVILKHEPYATNKRSRIGIIAVSIVTFLFVIVGVILSINTLRTRTDVQVYIKWSGTMTGHDLMQKFMAQEPASIVTYRYIVDNDNGYAASCAARRIAVIGEPAEDLPRLNAVKLRMKDDFDRARIQEAIDSLTAHAKQRK